MNLTIETYQRTRILAGAWINILSIILEYLQSRIMDYYYIQTDKLGFINGNRLIQHPHLPHVSETDKWYIYCMAQFSHGIYVVYLSNMCIFHGHWFLIQRKTYESSCNYKLQMQCCIILCVYMHWWCMRMRCRLVVLNT